MDNTRRREGKNRRRTVSGAVPDLQNEKRDVVTPIETMRFPWSSPSAPTTPTGPTPAQSVHSMRTSSGHKRSSSSNIFSRFNFLGSGSRPPSWEQRPASRDKEQTSPTKSLFARRSVEDDDAVVSPTSPSKGAENGDGGALSAALKQGQKTRKRKGSLRKTALLGGKKIGSEGRERSRSFSLLQRNSSVGKGQVTQQQPPATDLGEREAVEREQLAEGEDVLPLEDESSNLANPDSNPSRLERNFSYQNDAAASSSGSGWSEPAAVSAARLTLLTEHQQQLQANGAGRSRVDELGSPLDVKSPTSQTSHTSTTVSSDDDLLTFPPPPHHPHKPQPAPLTSVATGSYFPPLSASPSTSTSLIAHRRSSKRRSPLSRTTTLPTPHHHQTSSSASHDYTTTEYWGWIILFITWLTFTVGMGSCLEIWSWAWDVGETPYAPPELEDDPTLPIVGYYPALMVLTGVAAWVWITVAWVGMKYFRHAKIEV